MYKDFNRWNEIKKEMDAKDLKVLYFREREVWWCSLGINIGDEENGKGAMSQRPVLILRKFNMRIMLVIPVTTRIKPDNRFYMPIACPDGRTRSVIISQIRIIDTRRLGKRMFMMDLILFQNIKKEIRHLFA